MTAKILFSAYDSTNGFELWITDGTAAGTSLLKNIYSGSGSSFPASITSLGNGSALFQAYDPTNGRELWITDGTAAGTSLLKDINSGSSGSSPFPITSLGNGSALFSAYDSTNGFELWITDGTAGGTSLLKNIYSGSSSSFPGSIISLGNGSALFQADDGTNGFELWISDGTAGGTSLLKNIYSGSGSSFPASITSLGNGSALFQAYDPTNGRELWITDGTAAGTSLLKDIVSGSSSSYPGSITSLGNGSALFRATDGTNGFELWITDGTAGGTSLLKDIVSGSGNSYPGSITSLGNGSALFQAFDSTNGVELWITDGTAGGTSLLKDIVSGSSGSYPGYITSLGNGSALFNANDGTNGFELWITDGTAAGTSLLKDINSGSSNSSPNSFAVLVAPCFVTGTLIATPDGQRPVEALRAGDRVLTHGGEARPVRWVGHRSLDLVRHPAPHSACPIRIRAGALADGVPSRDLRVSPEHAMYLQGGLVPARLLVNGATILRETDCRRVTYHHIELDTHDILVAEDAPSESYLDTGNRGLFENAATPLILHPTFEDGQAGRVGRSCAPLLAEPAVVEPIWRSLAKRAATLGTVVPTPAVTQDAAPRLLVDGRTLQPLMVRGTVMTFVVAAGATSIRLLSHASPPNALRPWEEDSRALGLSVQRIRVSEAGMVSDMPLDHPGLTDGWWDVEGTGNATWRWTSGNAVLPLGAGSARIIEITAGQMEAYLSQPAQHTAMPQAA